MAAPIFLQPFPQYFDDAGAPLIGGKLYSYEAGSSTPLTVYHDPALATPWTWPIVLDAAGRIPGQVFVPSSPASKWTLFDADGHQIGVTADHVSAYVAST